MTPVFSFAKLRFDGALDKYARTLSVIQDNRIR